MAILPWRSHLKRHQGHLQSGHTPTRHSSSLFRSSLAAVPKESVSLEYLPQPPAIYHVHQPWKPMLGTAPRLLAMHFQCLSWLFIPFLVVFQRLKWLPVAVRPDEAHPLGPPLRHPLQQPLRQGHPDAQGRPAGTAGQGAQARRDGPHAVWPTSNEQAFITFHSTFLLFRTMFRFAFAQLARIRDFRGPL